MIQIKKVRQAEKLIKNTVFKTPLIHSPVLSRMFGCEIFLKLENLQKTGSFKIRGAAYKIMACRHQIGLKGVVAASAGNHAQGIALAAQQAGIPSTIVMPEWASISKQEATRSYGGNVVISGKSIAESLDKARKFSKDGSAFIHPFDDEDIITGQGTIALEIFEETDDADLVVVPVGGGGLISGIASVIRSMKLDTKVIGVQTSVCPSAYESLKKGKITPVDSLPSIADGISVRKTGKTNFKIIKKCVDDIVLVEEDQIASAILLLLERKKILSEGAGAAPLAALLNGSIKVKKGSRVILVISGGNLDSPLLGRIISQGLIKNGRIMRLRVRLSDTPGSMAKLLDTIARLNANVLNIYHARNVTGEHIFVTHVDIELETRGISHVEEIANMLKTAGYDIQLK